MSGHRIGGRAVLRELLVAVFISLAFTWSGEREGSFWSKSAAAPLTKGAAMLVPLNWK